MLLNAYAETHGPTAVSQQGQREIIAAQQLEIGHLRSMDVYINELKHYCAKLNKRILPHKNSDAKMNSLDWWVPSNPEG